MQVVGILTHEIQGAIYPTYLIRLLITWRCLRTGSHGFDLVRLLYLGYGIRWIDIWFVMVSRRDSKTKMFGLNYYIVLWNVIDGAWVETLNKFSPYYRTAIYLFNVTFVFARRHPNLAVVTHVKYERDSKDLIYPAALSYICQASPKFSCGDTCQIWTWLKGSDISRGVIIYVRSREPNERSCSNHRRCRRVDRKNNREISSHRYCLRDTIWSHIRLNTSSGLSRSVGYSILCSPWPGLGLNWSINVNKKR